MTFTPIVAGTPHWDVPLNAALTNLQNSITAAQAGSLQAANNLSDLTNISQARLNLNIVQNNLVATVNPTVSNDQTQGYAPSSVWVNTSTTALYVCITAATGAAQWNLLPNLPLSVALGGTGSSTQNFVDLTSAQSIAGVKTFTSQAVFSQTSGVNVQVTGSAVGQKLVEVQGTDVTSTALASMLPGDTFDRLHINVDGTTSYGAGSAGRDVTVGRAATGIQYTTPTLLVGSATALGDNGVGEIQLANATSAPTTNPTGGALMYATGGNIKSRNSQGLVLSDAGVVSAVTSTASVTTTGLQSLYSVSIPANDPIAGAVYEITGYGVMTTSATATTMGFGVYWGGTAGTALAAIGTAPTLPASQTNTPFQFKGIVNFRTSTTAVAYMTFMVAATPAAGAVSTYITAASAAVTVTTSSAENLTVGINLNNAQTVSLTGGDVRRMS